MIEGRLRPPFFAATRDDADALAQFVDMAGEGLPLYLWERFAPPGMSGRDVGRGQVLLEDGAFSYRKAVLLRDADDPAGAPVGCLIDHVLPETPAPIDADLPAPLVPLYELQNRASGSWYVSVLATLPAHRGRGLASRLLDLAEARGRAAGRRHLSLIVDDANIRARRLYEARGWRELDRRPIVRENWTGGGCNWILLTRPLQA